jgi:hypothetical protein
MAFQVKAFFFERYGNGGMDIVVRGAAASNGPIIADVVLDSEKLKEVFDYLGIKVGDGVELAKVEEDRDALAKRHEDTIGELAKVEGERNVLYSKNEDLERQIEDIPLSAPAEQGDPVAHEEDTSGLDK